MEKGVQANPGLLSATLLGTAWPITLFLESFRHPEHCRHPEHPRRSASNTPSPAASSLQVPAHPAPTTPTHTATYMEYLVEQYKQQYIREAMERVEWMRQNDERLRPASRPTTTEPRPFEIGTELDASRLAQYQRDLANNLSGTEQQALSPANRETYVAAQGSHVLMASWQKPDINGYREGDRVKLTEEYRGETGVYTEGSIGTVVITNTAPSSIRVARESHLLEVLMDTNGMIILDIDSNFTRIEGQVRVSYYDDGRVTARTIQP
ncbi:hypothetical protein OHA70_28185 [Kribbella sp. NBC_00382]|uniref:hypothetical protein n=1 Tax=Kribbella sp. NBC_00382 TaxID=2975967 RepID=UPI002E235EE1